MGKKIAETLPSIDIVVLNRLGVLTADMRFIDPRVIGAELAGYLRPVGVSNGTVFLRSYRGAGLQFRVHWVRTGVALRPWFACSCGRNVRRLYCDDDVWACRRCHRLTYAAMMDPDRRHWVGSGKILRTLRMLGSDSADPFSPLPPRPPGMWRKKYDRLARDFRAAQKRLLHSLAGAAQWSIAQQNHQIAYGRLVKQRKELRARTLDLRARQKESFNPRYWTQTALMSGDVPDLLTDDEEREFNELRRRNGRMEDVERFVAANSDWVTMTRTSRRGGEGGA
jgi:hypothetical protein